MVKDPVCGMIINEEEAAGYTTYKKNKYFFCAPGCKIKFIKDPKKYVEQIFSDPDNGIKASRYNYKNSKKNEDL